MTAHTSTPATNRLEQSRLRKGLRRLARGSLGLLGVTLLTGAIFQCLSVRRDNVAYPAPGKVIDVDGAAVHLLCMGEGNPIVLFDAGAGGLSVEFVGLMREVSAFTRSCAYDRPGFGWSDPVADQTALQVAERLHAALVAAGETGPYVVVGHSLGGVYSRAFASRYRSEVTGMLLIDSSGDDQWLRFPPELTRDSFPWAQWACRLGNPFGIYRALRIPEREMARFPVPPEVLPMMIARMHTNQFCASLLELNSIMKAVASQSIRHDFGDLPLIVLEADVDMREIPADQLPDGVSRETMIEAQQTWHQIQVEHARMSSRGELIVAQGSGHFIHFDRPDLVMESLRRLASP